MISHLASILIELALIGTIVHLFTNSGKAP